MKNEPRARCVEVCTAALFCLLATLHPSISHAESLPSGWMTTNVGNPAIPGSAVYSSGVFSVSGAGAAIWGTTDQFLFAHRQLIGDGVIIAKVTGLVGTSSKSQAGIMIRESLSAGSKNAFVRLSSSEGVSLQWRSTTGSYSWAKYGGSGKAPVWLKLERQSSTFKASRSNDGVTWTTIGSTTLSISNTAYIGLAVGSYVVSKLALATFSNVTTGAHAPTPGNQPPSVSLTAPTSGATYTAPATITFAATASDTNGSITRVDFAAGGSIVGSDTSAPYAFTWSNVPAGSYSLTATARDNAGATTISAARTVTVSSTSTNKPPFVSLTSPSAGAVFTEPASFSIAANASDSDGSISRVEFYRGTILLGSDTSSPYSLTWSNVAAGTYSLTAVARDNAGGTTVSGTVSVLVVSTQLPKRAIFTPSANHSTAVNSYLLEIFTAGSNPATSSPIATLNMGKPPVVNGVCDVGIATTVTSLPPGSYIGTVTAIGNGGQAQSAPSPPFTR